MRNRTPLRPNWNRVYWDRFVKIRDRLRGERGKGLNSLSDSKIDARARREAEQQVQTSINRWRESKGLDAPELRDL